MALLYFFLVESHCWDRVAGELTALQEVSDQRKGRPYDSTYRQHSGQRCLAGILKTNNRNVHLGGPKHPQQPVPQPCKEARHGSDDRSATVYREASCGLALPCSVEAIPKLAQREGRGGGKCSSYAPARLLQMEILTFPVMTFRPVLEDRKDQLGLSACDCCVCAGLSISKLRMRFAFVAYCDMNNTVIAFCCDQFLSFKGVRSFVSGK